MVPHQLAGIVNNSYVPKASHDDSGLLGKAFSSLNSGHYWKSGKKDPHQNIIGGLSERFYRTGASRNPRKKPDHLTLWLRT